MMLFLTRRMETASSFHSRQKYYPQTTWKLVKSVRAVALFWSAGKSLAKQMASNKYNRPGCEKLLRQTSPAYYLHKSAHWLHLGLPKQAWHFDLPASGNTVQQPSWLTRTTPVYDASRHAKHHVRMGCAAQMSGIARPKNSTKQQ